MPRVSLPEGAEPVQDDAYTAPATQEEFWARDWAYVMKLTRALMRDKAEAEDVAADIFEKLLRRDVPGMYQPGVVSKHTKKRVTWRAFLSAQVALYVRGKQEQVGRRIQREPLLCDSTVGDGTAWLDLFGNHADDAYPSLGSDFVAQVRERLAALPAWDGPSLLDMFEEVLAHVQDGGKVSLGFLRKKFGLSQAGAEEALSRLRQEVSRSQVPVTTVEVAGITLTAAEAAEAAALLEAAPGSHVRPVFARAGHKLAAAGTRWYLPVAREELKLYPGLRTAGGTHATGHVSHVKAAVVHWLRRAAEGASVALEVIVTSPEPSPAEELESRLWKLGASPSDVSEIMELARVAYGVRRRAS